MMRKRTTSGSREELPRSIGLGDSGTPDLPEREEEYLSGFGSDGLACHPHDLPELHRYGIRDTSEDPCIEES